jgi:hypothetical protein
MVQRRIQPQATHHHYLTGGARQGQGYRGKPTIDD